MQLKTLKQEALRLYQDWQKRKGWDSDYSGTHTTPEEDEMAKILLRLIYRLK